MKTVYLNHAGTSWPKPDCVVTACKAALQADPQEWDSAFNLAHTNLAEYFSIRDRSRLLLTPGCTSSLSIAVADHDWRVGDRVVTSGLEHHALHRPLVKLTEQGVELEIIPPDLDSPFNLNRLGESLRKGKVKLVAVTAASNVTGDLLPIDDIIELAHQHEALVLVDGAQIVGWQDIDLVDLGVDLFAFGGHKGLQAPWGIGGLYVAPHVSMNALQAVCEVETAQQPEGCSAMSGYCDVGSVDRIALEGLRAALAWLEKNPIRLDTARKHASALWEVVSDLPGVTLYGSSQSSERMPTVAFTLRGRRSAEIAESLRQRGVIAAAGLQCAPLAHELLGSAPEGVVRLSVGTMTNDQDIDFAYKILQAIG